MANSSSKIMQNLLTKIQKKKAKITIVGLGYVGLPTAVLFANSGYFVTAIDVKSSIIKNINEGYSPINEPGLHQLISSNIKAGRLKAKLNSDISFENQDMYECFL